MSDQPRPSDDPRPSEGAAREAARDRLTDRVLAEALGGEAPPDQTEAILARAEAERVDVAVSETDRVPSKRRRLFPLTWLETAIAASLLVGLYWLTIPAVNSARHLALGLPPADEAEQAPAAGRVVVEPPTVDELRYQSPSPSAEPGMASESIFDDAAPAEAEAEVDQPDVMDDLFAAPPTPEAPALGRSSTVPFKSEPDERALDVGNVGSAETNRVPISERRKAIELLQSRFEASKRTTIGFEPRASSGTERSAVASPPASAPVATLGRATRRDAPAPAGPPGRMPANVREEILRFNVGFLRQNERNFDDRLRRDRYAPLVENEFVAPIGGDALSTFSIDVDTASYANARQYLLDSRRLPPKDSVRIEEFINYFDYADAPPADTPDGDMPGGDGSDAPFAATMRLGVCPWNADHRLVRIGLKGREVNTSDRPPTNLVFLIDVSGSMNSSQKLPLVVEGLKALTAELDEDDRVAIVVYAGSEGVVLPSTHGDDKQGILEALDRLRAGGSTAGGAGLRLAYEIAERNRVEGGVNRVVLCTDGDFNVGLTGTEQLAELVETRRKETGVFLTVLGFGRGNLNDAMLEAISGRGDGNYYYLADVREARRVLGKKLSGTLVAIAKDVKLQVEFNPARVARYRLIGYENRLLAARDFNDDTKDAGEIGAGHTVTALYEIVPVGVTPPAPPVDGLKYQTAEGSGQTAEKPAEPTADSAQPTATSSELLTLKIRYKAPEGGASTKLEFPLEGVEDDATLRSQETIDFRWAAAVAEFGMLLRESRHAAGASYDAVLDRARAAIGDDPSGDRAEFLDLVRAARELSVKD